MLVLNWPRRQGEGQRREPGGGGQRGEAGGYEEARRRLLAVEERLREEIVGRESYIRAALLALVAREHVLLVSPPGTAKTMLADRLAALVAASSYRYLLTRYTDFSELFGPVDIRALAEEGVYRRRWSRIVDAEIVFLDEVFKANSAILNSLLSLMQERRVYDPYTGQPVQARLWTLIGASNETPSDDELAALLDRFAIRVFERYIEDDRLILKALEARWARAPAAGHLATMDDVRVVHEHAVDLLRRGLYKQYHEHFVQIAKTLRARGIIVSDRTIVEKMALVYAAYLALYGVTRENAEAAALEIARFVARDEAEAREVDKAVKEMLGEVGGLLERIEEARRLARAGELKQAAERLRSVLDFDVSRLADKPWLRARAEAAMAEARRLLKKIEELQARAEGL
jgi:MoxR-like ATPase